MASAARRVPVLPKSLYANVQAFQPSAKHVNADIEIAGSPKAAAIVARAAELEQAHKVDQFARIQDKGRARSEALAAQIKALQKRKAHVDARNQRHEERFITELQAGGYDKIHGFHAEYALKPAPLALQVLDESQIPDEYIRTSFVTAPDKIAIKAALQRGEEINGVALTQKVTLCRK